MKLKNMYMKPREKAIKEGINKLSDTELLAILLNTGSNKLDVMELSDNIIESVGKITNFMDLTYQELITIKGIKDHKALTILSAIELGRRIYSYKDTKLSFNNPKNIYDFLKNDILFLKQENFIALYCDSKGKYIDKKLISIGNTNSVICDISEVFKWYYILKASCFYIVHNHPSLNPFPSKNDNRVTFELIERSSILNINFVDHIILGDGYFSYLNNSNIFKISFENELRVDEDYQFHNNSYENIKSLLK